MKYFPNRSHSSAYLCGYNLDEYSNSTTDSNIVLITDVSAATNIIVNNYSSFERIS